MAEIIDYIMSSSIPTRYVGDVLFSLFMSVIKAELRSFQCCCSVLLRGVFWYCVDLWCCGVLLRGAFPTALVRGVVVVFCCVVFLPVLVCVAYLSLGGNYWTLAIAGLLIGLVRWFSAYSGANPPWDKKKKTSEAIKSGVFGLVVMPAAIDMAAPTLNKYGVCTPATEILVGVVASFFAVELFSAGLKFVNRKAES